MISYKKVSLLIIVIVAIVWNSYRGISDIKSHSQHIVGAAGYKITGYEGYTGSMIYGGQVWYIMTRIGDNRITYECCLVKWFGEYHIYNLKAIDAITPEKD